MPEAADKGGVEDTRIFLIDLGKSPGGAVAKPKLCSKIRQTMGNLEMCEMTNLYWTRQFTHGDK